MEKGKVSSSRHGLVTETETADSRQVAMAATSIISAVISELVLLLSTLATLLNTISDFWDNRNRRASSQQHKEIQKAN